MRRVLLLILIVVLPAGCGEDVPDREVERDTPAVTAPGTELSYEGGGADGSGADGSERRHPRGGIAAGPDDPDPGEQPGADTETKPPRGNTP